MNSNEPTVLCEASRIDISVKVVSGIIITMVLTFNGWVIRQVADLQKAVIDNQRSIAVLVNEQKNSNELMHKFIEKSLK